MPLNAVTRNGNEILVVLNPEKLQVNALQKVESLQSSLKTMHETCAERAENHRKASVDAHNRRTGFQKGQFHRERFRIEGRDDQKYPIENDSKMTRTIQGGALQRSAHF